MSNKSILILGVTANLALLGFFKYTDFLLENINLAFDGGISLLHITLPLAISFFTFQQIAYLVDSYRGEVDEHDFLNYAVFVSFFPQLIAGPIVHHKEMMPQFANLRKKVLNYRNISIGLFIFSCGLFKKVMIADTFSVLVGRGFDVSEKLTLLEAWGTSLSYTFQLYYDFSGYADMAIGAALMFNIHLPKNFNYPYGAENIQDFWRRWHMTLSRFLRDYIYIPLGGNRQGTLRSHGNLIVTFLLGGLWHGAAWTFVFWGFLHGAALLTHRLWKATGIRMNRILAWAVTFNFINISWVFFRAKEWEDAIKVTRGMLGLDGFAVGGLAYLSGLQFPLPFDWFIPFSSQVNLIVIVLFLGIIFVEGKMNLLALRQHKPRLFYSLMFFILVIPLLNLRKISEFLYFQF